MDNHEADYIIEFLASKTRKSFSHRFARQCTVGSGEGCDLSLPEDGVKPFHARIFAVDGALFIEPEPDASLTLNGNKIEKAGHLNSGDWLLVGSALYQIKFETPGTYTASRGKTSGTTPTASPGIDVSGRSTLTVGRQPRCELEIVSPLVSRLHAKLIREPSGWFLEDCGSTNGTFVNARRIRGKHPIYPNDRISFAVFEYVFDGDCLAPAENAGKVRIEVRNLVKEVKDRNGRLKRLLNGISFAVNPGEFVGIFGTSGSGKSTLLDALNGRRPATGGQITYNGTDLYKAFDLFRTGIGYVPQQDIVHRKIMMRHALKYTAELRLPPDVSDNETLENVTRVLEKVGLAEKASLSVDTPAPLSGGQLKRVSLAVELVANPNVLFLDEVTSGLDAGTDKKMMQLFRELAEDKKTVVCVTHTLENIDACHLVALLHQGRLVFYGPPQAVNGYFGIPRLSDVYELLESREAAEWEQKFKTSNFYDTYVRQRFTASASDEAPADKNDKKENGGRRKFFDWRQTRILMFRYVELIFSDRKNLLILIVQAPLIALVIGLVFKIDPELQLRAAKESQISFILVLSAIWFGCLNSARELVKELPIYLRERSVNLSLAPYILSKLMPLAVLCLIQCLLLLGIISLMVDIPGDLFMRFNVLFASSLAATAMGLCVSAFVNSNDKAVATIPILLIPQVILSGAIVKLEGAGLWIAKLTMIAYWAFDAMKGTLSEEIKAARDFRGEAILAIESGVGSDLAVIMTLGLFFLLTACVGLKLKDKK
ncbi:MAG: ATP-binding cassette domain-containing protein [Gammaproteobacteria bacterium]